YVKHFNINTKILKLFSKYGTDFNMKDKEGFTLLNFMTKTRIYPIKPDFFKSIEYLINKVDPNIQDDEGNTPLMNILKCIWDINIQQHYHRELDGCGIECDLEFMKILLKYGANPNIQNNKFQTALMIICD